MRSMWKGTVSFGLVSIPIQLYAATESKSISFRQVHAADGGRIQYKRVCTVDGAEVPYADIAKGYELEDGSMVVLTDDDLAQVPVATSRAIEVVEFLPIEAIDPISYDRAYYLEPQKTATKPYVLLRDALAKSGRVALVKVALRQRESLALLRVHNDVLVLTTLLWPGEVRKPDFEFLADPPQVRDQELAMAGSLIDSMTEDVFDPDAHHDSYQQALRELIDAKIAGEETTAPAAEDRPAEVVDLMAALEASISNTQARGNRPESTTTGDPEADGAGTAAKPRKSGGKRAARRQATDEQAEPAAEQDGSKKPGSTASTRKSGGRRSKSA
ncbi:DNA end-binding protein Ku [Tamaricihabitans halophyticus]|uniref:Non-homologous end joining protein Ku n=1 Tax=Tamaricihabitans halophyticus TaxID=1262583 RepID=A0A4R2QMJ1_9PSEU|nr:Ku protein [Tamaricihabitans halophyticus]TCP50772.1 DNA end-binding protein Ku [Tamaricihabitans halophyticus]